MLSLLFVGLSISILVSSQNFEKSRSVWVEQGLIRGKIYKINDNYMQIFRGIPYAEPAVGDNRFKKPVKKGRWHQEYSAIDFGPPCLQFMNIHLHDKFSGPNMEYQSEDCLYLNVFSPYEPEDEGKLYPILVWIHGGSFLAGSGDTGIDMEVVAKNFIFNGIVLVTLNYRLGPLGFLTYRIGEKVHGNFGIWDQVMALEWIQANMKQLNGDPSRVTIIGESAGAAAVSLLAVSPVTINLIHQVIALSGSATAGWAINRHGPPKWDIQNLAAYLRCDKNFDEDVFVGQKDLETEYCNLQDSIPNCISDGIDMNTQELVECFRNELNFSFTPFRQALAVELGVSKMVVDGELILSSGSDLILNNARVPIMIGVARNEWAHKKAHFYDFRQYANTTYEECAKNVRKIINEDYHTGCAQKLSEPTINLISNTSFLRYIDTPVEDWSLPRIISALQNLESDIEFVAPAQKEIDAYVANDLPVYAYSFDYVPRTRILEEERKSFSLFGKDDVKVIRKEIRSPSKNRKKAFHGLDHAFIFTRGYSTNMQITPFSKRDAHMSKMLTTMISNFVKSGDPTSTPWNGFSWLPYTNQTAQYVLLDLPPKMAMGSLHWPATNFWNKELKFLEQYTFSEKGVEDDSNELTSEERLQLAAYRRAWWALWLLVAAIALVIWLSVICIVVTRCQSPTAKPYNNIIVNR